MKNHRLFGKSVVAAGAVLAATLLAGGASAQQFGQQTFAPEATMWRWFGYSLASDATTLVVGAPESYRNHDTANCGQVGYGAIAVYKKTNGTWNFSQSFWHDTTPNQNEIKFGDSLSLRGNTLVVSAPREDDGSIFGAGAFLVYTRPSASGSFAKLGTYFSPAPLANDRIGDITGVATNGSFIAVGEHNGVIHVYQLQNGVVSYRYDVMMAVQAPASGLYITDSGTLVANLVGWPTLMAYQLGASSYSTVNVSSLSIPNAVMAGYQADGRGLAGDGNTVVATLNSDSGTTMSTQVVNFNTSGIAWSDTRVIPPALVQGGNYPMQLTIKEGSGFFASFSGFDGNANYSFALGYRYTPNSGSGHDYNFAGTFLPRNYSNLASSPNPANGLTFNGTDLVAGDEFLQQQSGGGSCDFTSNGAIDAFTLGPTTVQGPGASNKLQPSITPSAGMGDEVANYGSYALVASGYSGGEPGLEGQVTLFKHGSQWEALERYVDDYGETFGKSVAVNQHSLFIGAPTGGANYTGLVYVANAITNGYQHGLLKQTLALPGDTLGGEFGSSLAVDGETLIVGADLAGPVGDGSAYIYTWNSSSQTWGLAQELQPPSSDVVWGIFFGGSVAISGDWAVVGAPSLSRNNLIQAGGIYVYHRVNGTFSYVQRLIASNSSNVDEFGQSLAINGSNIAASGAASGVHLFHLGTTTFASDGAITVSGQQFVPVALSSSGLVVATASDARVRRYTRSGTNNWPLAGTLAGPTGESFGSSIALQNTNVLIGASTSRVGSFATGAGYAIQFGSF